jgi:hypothetical protein
MRPASAARAGASRCLVRAGLYAAAAWLVVACTPQPAGPPHNVATAASPRVAIAPDQALGWIAIAPRPREAEDWIPEAPQALIVPVSVEGLTAGVALSAIDTAGKVTRVTATVPTRVPYGCDNHQLEVLAFTGDSSAPGPVWLLPPAAPPSWRPGSLAIASPVAASEAHRRDTVGPLVLELARREATRGTLAIARDGRVLHSVAIERPEMEGADPAPLDLRRPGVAIPVPAAAWSFADGGPILLVLQVPSYEGLHLRTFLVESDAAREISSMALYLYRCAF